jgi:transposase
VSRILAPPHLGLDVHKDTISVAILAPDRDGPDVERIAHDEASIEAGPTGYDLARLLHSAGVGCQVIAPSLIPKAPATRSRPTREDRRRTQREQGRSD